MLWRRIRSLCRRLAKRLLSRVVDEIIDDLAKTTVDRQVQITALNTRLMELPLALRNINHVVAAMSPAMPERTPTRAGVSPLASKMCTQRDCESDWLAFWAFELRAAPIYDRKMWEFCYVAETLHSLDMLRPGRDGLGFGCGREPLPSLFAKYGAAIMATDLPATHGNAAAWLAANAHAADREAVLRRDICPDDRIALIRFRCVDMNDVPEDLNGQFDFCWSCCALEHLGSLAAGMAFVERSLDTLKPGGVAVHTTEFSLDAAAAFDNFPTVHYRPEHFLSLAERVRRRGCRLAELDFDPGDGILDRLPTLATLFPDVESQPDLARVKVSLGGFLCTSFGLIITKDATAAA